MTKDLVLVWQKNPAPAVVHRGGDCPTLSQPKPSYPAEKCPSVDAEPRDASPELKRSGFRKRGSASDACDVRRPIWCRAGRFFEIAELGKWTTPTTGCVKRSKLRASVMCR